jgi:hypothetical protein
MTALQEVISRLRAMWQPTMTNTFHVPESFGLLRLTETVE